MRYLLGIDCGTSGTKTVLFDEKGVVIASASAEYPLYQPHNGYAEQDAEDWKKAMLETIGEVIAKSGVDSADIAGIGLSGQMHGLVMLGSDGNVLRKSIIWCDQRTGEQVDKMNELCGEKIAEISANPALTGWTAAKILWVRDNEPQTYEKCRHILLPKDYLRYVLTGELATEVSDASGMQLLDVKNRCWSGELCELLGIDKGLLAPVYESCEVTGRITKQIAELTGLKEGTIVVGGAGDNAAAALGTGVCRQGRAFTTIGTSGVVFAHTDTPLIDPKGRVHTCCAAVPNGWHVMGVTQAAGLSLRWFRDNFCESEMLSAKQLGVSEYELMSRQAEEIPAGCERLLYLPYLMGERTPHLDADARGVFFGLSAVHTKKHMLRAVMEGVAYSLRDCVEIFREMGVSVSDMAACGGGGSSPLWRSMLADLYGCGVKTVTSKEGPALGAAILASVGAGVYSSVEQACETLVQSKDTTPPDTERAAVYEQYYQMYRSLYPALKGSYQALKKL